MILKGKRFAVGPVFFTMAMVLCLLCLQLPPGPVAGCATGRGFLAVLS